MSAYSLLGGTFLCQPPWDVPAQLLEDVADFVEELGLRRGLAVASIRRAARLAPFGFGGVWIDCLLVDVPVFSDNSGTYPTLRCLPNICSGSRAVVQSVWSAVNASSVETSRALEAVGEHAVVAGQGL